MRPAAKKNTLNTRVCSFEYQWTREGPHGGLKCIKARARTEKTLYALPGRYMAPFSSRTRPKSVTASRSSRAHYVVFWSVNLVYLALRLSTRSFFRSPISCIWVANLWETKKKLPRTLAYELYYILCDWKTTHIQRGYIEAFYCQSKQLGISFEDALTARFP